MDESEQMKVRVDLARRPRRVVWTTEAFQFGVEFCECLNGAGWACLISHAWRDNVILALFTKMAKLCMAQAEK